MENFKRLFTDHPSSVNETYLEHMWFALRWSFKLGLCCGAGLVHAVFPFMFKDYGSSKVGQLNDWVKTRD